MSKIKKCIQCDTTNSPRFRSLAGDKWDEAEASSLIEEKWVKGNKLCHNCYMNYVQNPLKKGVKRVKVSVEADVDDVVAPMGERGRRLAGRHG